MSFCPKTNSWNVINICTIILLDSESNHTYKLIGREAMRAAIDHIQIAPEQYSRPQCSALAHGINRILIFD